MKLALILVLVGGLLFASLTMYVISLRVRSVLAVTMPDNVRLGDEFVAWLTLRNAESAPITLDHFTIDSTYETNFADGLIVVSTDPPYQQRKKIGKGRVHI